MAQRHVAADTLVFREQAVQSVVPQQCRSGHAHVCMAFGSSVINTGRLGSAESRAALMLLSESIMPSGAYRYTMWGFYLLHVYPGNVVPRQCPGNVVTQLLQTCCIVHWNCVCWRVSADAEDTHRVQSAVFQQQYLNSADYRTQLLANTDNMN